MSDFKRARSDEQKEQRMQEIKDAADAMFSREPYHRITLSALADALGCSRTQIYKYAATKEEIFLELSSDKRKEYFDAMMAAFPEGCSYPLNVFAEVWAGILNAHRDFLRYGDILLSIIETNVSVERLALYKRQYYDDLGRILDMLQGQLHIDRDSATKLYMTVYFQAVGLNAYCLKSPPAWKALDMANLSTDPLDFREAIRDFILMCLDRYCPSYSCAWTDTAWMQTTETGEPPGDRQHGRTHGHGAVLHILAPQPLLRGSGARVRDQRRQHVQAVRRPSDCCQLLLPRTDKEVIEELRSECPNSRR